MNITYNFNGDEFVYNTSLEEYVEDTYGIDDILDLYIENIYRKNPNIVNELKSELDIDSEEELKDYIYYMNDDLWMIDELINALGEDYFDDAGVKEFYEDDAYEEYLDMISIEDIENEDAERRIQKHWW